MAPVLNSEGRSSRGVFSPVLDNSLRYAGREKLNYRLGYCA